MAVTFQTENGEEFRLQSVQDCRNIVQRLRAFEETEATDLADEIRDAAVGDRPEIIILIERRSAILGRAVDEVEAQGADSEELRGLWAFLQANTPQLATVLNVEGQPFLLTRPETREIVAMLREPNPHVPAADLSSIAAAVMLERLLEDPTARNPTLKDEEIGGLLNALGRMLVLDGLSGRQAALHEALLAYAIRRDSADKTGDQLMVEDVVIDSWASPQEASAIEDAFARAGFSVDVERAYETRSTTVAPWIIHVTLAAPIAAFFVAFASEAGKDAYQAVKAWAKEIVAARRDPNGDQGAVRMVDPDGTNLILPATIPDDALDALADIDWSAMRGGYLMWDEDAREWRDVQPRRD